MASQFTYYVGCCLTLIICINPLTYGNLFSLSYAAGTESAPELKKLFFFLNHQFHQNTLKETNSIFFLAQRYFAQVLNYAC